VKVIFQVEDETPERMWVILTEQPSDTEWIGIIDNDPVGETTSQVLSAGTEVHFHPLDVIQIDKKPGNRRINQEYLYTAYGIDT
jgi:hypothetical protein